MKYFRMSYKEVVYQRSFINIMLLNRAIPGVKPLDEEQEKQNTKGNDKAKGRHSKTTKIKDNCNSLFMNLMG